MRRLVSLVPLALLALAACGGSDDSSPQGTAGSGTAGSSGGSGAAGGAGTAGAATGFVPPKYEPGAKPASVTFPATFLFASASAGQQVESGLPTDWVKWADKPGKTQGGAKPDAGPDFWAHVDDDIAAMKSAGLGAYRLSIELARLYPTKEAFDADTPDADALAKYDGLLAKLKTAGIVPMVTLHHFAHPTWQVDVDSPKTPQGWERPESVDVFATWAERAAKRWGDKVDWWVTINEPNVESTVGYLLGGWPPGIASPDRMMQAQKNQVYAHAKAYDRIHAVDTVDADGDGKAAMVSMALHQRVYRPKDPTNPDDVLAANHSAYFWNYWYLHACIRGDLDMDVDEKLDGADDKKADPDLAKRFDFIGLNYYGHSLVADQAAIIKYMGRQPAQMGLPTGKPKTAMGWDIVPEGFGEVLEQTKEFALPVFITENGVAAEPMETTRPRFVAEHLFEVGWAIQRGLDVRGYAYWALTDNFEWQSGYCPKFGLYTIDYTKPEKPRTPAAGRDTLKGVADKRSLSQAEIDALAPYPAMPASTCKSF